MTLNIVNILSLRNRRQNMNCVIQNLLIKGTWRNEYDINDMGYGVRATMKSFTQYHALLLQSHYNLPVTQQRGYQMFRILQWVWYVHKKSN